VLEHKWICSVSCWQNVLSWRRLACVTDIVFAAVTAVLPIHIEFCYEQLAHCHHVMILCMGFVPYWDPSLYLLVSWAWWDWPLTSLTNHHHSVLWRCWLGHVTLKIVSEMTYNVSSGTLNTTIPYHTIPCALLSLIIESGIIVRHFHSAEFTIYICCNQKQLLLCHCFVCIATSWLYICQTQPLTT